MVNVTADVTSLDFLNYLFFSLELTFNIVFVFIFPVYTYWCARQRTLHINFRILLQTANIGLLIGAIQRILLIIDRMVWIGNGNTPFVMALMYPLFFGSYLFSGGWVVLVLERVYASFTAGSYEKKCRSCLEISFVTFLGVLPAVLVTLLKALDVQGIFDYVLLGFDFVVDVATFLALIYILRFNKKHYKKRHNNDLQLTTRYQLSENIRATNYVIPVALVDFIGQIITIGVMSYSIFVTNIPLGQDTSHLSHAYDMIFAIRRLFFGMWLLVKNERFVYNGQRRAPVDVFRGDQENNQYFDDLRRQWE